MFVVRWVTRLLSLPFQWVGGALAMVCAPAGARVLAAAFWISRDGAVGRAYLLAISKIDKAAALTEAQRRPARYQPAEYDAYCAALSLDCGLTEAVGDYLERARSAGGDRLGMCEIVELMLAMKSDDLEAGAETARRLEVRDDLNPAATRLVQTELMWNAIVYGRFDEAGERARRLLAIAEQPDAHRILWAMAARVGDMAAAEKHHLKADQGPVGQRLYYYAVAAMSIGQFDDARSVLIQLQQEDPALAEQFEKWSAAIASATDAAEGGAM